jgi:hypothetical protein
MSDGCWLLAPWPPSESCDRVAVVGARGANKRGVRAALYRIAGAAPELQSNVVFAKCALLDDANADTSQPSRVHAFERVADQRSAALAVHAVLHSEAMRDGRTVFQLGLLRERTGAKLLYAARATLVCAADDAFLSDALEHRIVDAAPIVVARTRDTVLVWSDDGVRRFDTSQQLRRVVAQWPAVPLAHDSPVLLGVAATNSNETLRLHVPLLQSAVLAGVSAATALELASAAVAAERGATHHWARLTLRSDGSTECAPGWLGVLPSSVASLAAIRAVCVDEAQRSAWIVSESGTLLYCCNAQVLLTVELGERFARVRRLVPVDVDDAPALAVVGIDGVVAVCRFGTREVAVTENVRSVVRLSHDRLLLELADSDAVLGSIRVVASMNNQTSSSSSSSSERVTQTIAVALAARVRVARERLDRTESLLLAKRDLIESRLAMLHGNATRRVNVPSLQVVTVVGGGEPRAESPAPAAIDCDTDDDGVSVDQVEVQFADELSAQPMRARCRVRVAAAAAAAAVSDVSLTVLVRGRALQSTSYVEAEFLSPNVPQVAAVAAGGLAVATVCDLRVACEVADGADGARTDGVTMLVRWQWCRVASDDGRFEPAVPRRASQRLVALDSPLCRVVARDVEYLPHTTTLYVLPTSRRIEAERLSACVASELRGSGRRVRVRVVFRRGNDAIVDAAGQMGGGAMLQLRCASRELGASVVARLRTLLRGEFDADVDEDANCDGTAERMACVALLRECELLRALLEATRVGKPVELARVAEASVESDVCLNEMKTTMR